MKRIGVLTGGGDCPGLNAVLRAVVKTAENDYDVKCLGFTDGYEGLILNISINPVKSNTGEINKLAVLARDITRQKKIEKELSQASDEMERRVEQRTFELVRVNDELKHEIKQHKQTEKKLKDALEKLDLSKLKSDHVDYSIQLNDVFQIVNEAIIDLAPTLNEKNIQLTAAEPEIPTSLYCDAAKIGQVIHILLGNAIHYSPPEKSITIQYQKTQTGLLENQVTALQISVSDLGLGIPDDGKERIFDNSAQSSKSRSGLELAICKEIVTAHQGKIYVENNLEGGATFFLILPYRFQNS